MKTGIKNSIVALGFLGTFISFSNIAQAAYFNTTPIIRCNQTISRALSVGSQNNDVVTLQNYLYRVGYLQAYPNGYFGYQTKRAVQNFQADNYIRVTGTVGEQTRNALNERLCDSSTSMYSYDDYSYGYNTGVTYVDGYDPYAIVVSPNFSEPTVYATPQTYSNYSQDSSPSQIVISGTTIVSQNQTTPLTNGIIPATSQVSGTSIVYSPNLGYVVGVTPRAGSLTISTPSVNSLYNEGDTVNMVWTTSNLNATQYVVILENKNTRLTKTVAVTSSNSASFVLTKDVLDTVCAGICDNNQQGQFSIVVTTPVTDISGNTSTFRAAVTPITIKRPFGGFGYGAVSLTTSKTPVNNNEAFKLYVNIPTGASWNSSVVYGNYSFKIRASCPAGVQVSIAGATCGQDFTIPLAPTFFQQEIPAIINNTTWYKQDVTFTLTVTNLAGQVIGTSQTVVSSNGAPFSW